MNRLIFIIITVLTLPIINNINTKTEFSIVGTWEWDQYSSSGKIEFHKNGSVEIKLEKERKNGKLVLINGKNISLEYEFDNKKSPITLDLIATERESKNLFITPCIIYIIDNNTIIFAPGENGIRPLKVIDSDDRMVLIRIN